MGLEASCPVRVGREKFAVHAHLDSDRLTLRGGVRLDLPLKSIHTVKVQAGGALFLAHPTGAVTLELGDEVRAENWAKKIRAPKSLLDKLGLNPGSRVAVVGVADPDFIAQATQRLQQPPPPELRAGLDLIFFAADSPAQLAKLAALKRQLQPAGAIWVVSLKGKAATIRDTDVMRAARAAGLVDNKVCSFSATHTALRLVIPLAAR